MSAKTETPATAKPRPATRDHLRSLKKPQTKIVTILLDSDVLDAYEKAQAHLSEATAETRAGLEAELAEAKTALAESTVQLKFQSIGRKRYEDLVADHPATKEQNEQALKETQQEAPYNLDTFPPALIRASILEPELTEEDIADIYDNWNNAELMELFLAALEVNTQRRTVDLGNVFGPTLG